MDSSLLQQLSGIPEIFTGDHSARHLISSLHTTHPDGAWAIVTGASCLARGGAPADVLQQLLRTFPASIHLTIAGEPSDLWVDQARRAIETRSSEARPIDAVVSLGGGSALDAGKALAVMLEESGATMDFLEGVGTRKPSGKMRPWYAIPTTAGTGSEASTNAVLSRPGSHGFKKSLRHPAIRATAVALDGTMLTTQPAHLAAYCGLDAFTQLLESWSSRRAHHTAVAHLVSHLENGIEMAYHALPQLVELGPAHAAPHHRQAMLEAAFLSGIGLSHAGLGTAHGIAGHIGAYTTAPHAHACARLMAPCLRETLTWLENNPTSEHSAAALDQFRRLNQRLSPTLAPTHADAIQQILAWPQRFHIPPLLGYGLDLAAQEKILAAASDRDSPAHLGPAIWRRILQECLV